MTCGVNVSKYTYRTSVKIIIPAFVVESTIINLLTILSHDLVPRPHHCLQYRKVRAMESWVGAWE